MFEQVLKRYKGLAYACFRPVEEHALVAGDEDVSRIAVEVTQGIRNGELLERVERTLDAISQREKFLPREGRRRNFGLLVHEVGHNLDEGIDAVCERNDSGVLAAGIEKVKGLAKRRELQLSEGFGGCCPRGEVGALVEVDSLGFGAEPGVPLGARRNDARHEAGEKLRQFDRDGELTDVRFAHGLEPQGWAVGLEADQTKRRRSIELTETAGQPEAERVDLLLYPVRQAAEPAGFAERAGLPALRVGFQLQKGFFDCRQVFRRLEGIFRQQGERHPIGSGRWRLVRPAGLYDLILEVRHTVGRSRELGSEQTIGFEAPAVFHRRGSLFGDAAPSRDFDRRECKVGSAGDQQKFRSVAAWQNNAAGSALCL